MRIALIAAGLLLAACSSTSTRSDGDTATAGTTVATSVSTSVATTPARSEPASTETSPTELATTEPTTTEPTTTEPTTTEPGTGHTVAASPDRPYDVFVPSGDDGSAALPLVMLLHGYGATGVVQDEYFGLQQLAEERGFLYVHPEGTTDSTDRQFWNATDACCDDFGSGIDDSAYLLDIITQIEADYNVDA